MMAKQEVELHKSLQVVDSTKMELFQTCPRKFFFSEVLGFKPEQSSIHLEHGIAWHLALQEILENKHLPKEELLDRAIYAYLSHYNLIYSEEDAIGNAPKDPATTYRLLEKFLEQRWNWLQNIEVLHTEVLGAIPVTDTGVLYVKIDAIVRDDRGIYILDHKTTSHNTEAWRRHWTMSSQLSAYIHALYAVYPEDQVYGALVLGACFKKDPEIVEIEVVKTFKQIQAWLCSMQYWMEEYWTNINWLKEELPYYNEPILLGFPHKTSGCMAYNTLCPYYGLCEAYVNPLELWGKPPHGYTIRHWDPSDQAGRAELKGGEIVRTK